ncbi:hypothetical protein DICPUDRAFT_82336 [Dictyostelium purpureum]|uniref:GP-PDE domain-containing protein n=1 Tax=Dictyostelium purpureum TaxID=5786 RepID=F0ZW82_DICPU|nr:uncharacterized protein DICPUDRAFT_82336 [Dictyostelium purpureum]EGC31803.1 hypothetical protein DICPUDRAFT_82336 [Dictyostelium purpureum]|eukprot:XP_003291670.1 hypothetical protein DICPUDRAFT_82336 [Dictyostelium purpureum]
MVFSPITKSNNTNINNNNNNNNLTNNININNNNNANNNNLTNNFQNDTVNNNNNNNNNKININKKDNNNIDEDSFINRVIPRSNSISNGEIGGSCVNNINRNGDNNNSSNNNNGKIIFNTFHNDIITNDQQNSNSSNNHITTTSSTTTSTNGTYKVEVNNDCNGGGDGTEIKKNRNMLPHEILMTRVTFKIETPINYVKDNESVAVIGEGQEIGNWKVKDAPQLTNTEKTDSHLIWTTTLLFPKATRISYKYLILNNGLYNRTTAESTIENNSITTKTVNGYLDVNKKKKCLVEWEASRGQSRTLVVEGIDMFVNDGLFGVLESGSKPWIGRGWLPEDEYQLRVQLQVDESPVQLYDNFIDPTQLVLRLHDPFGLSQEFPLPLHGFTELVLHTHSPSVFGFSISLLLRENQTNGASTPSFDWRVLGRAYIGSKQCNDLWGKIYTPIIGEKLLPIGEFRCNYLVVSPFNHPQNSLSNLWHSFVEQPQTLIGHRGNGKNNFGINANAVTENTILSFLTAAQFGAKMVEFDLQLTYDSVPVIFHDYEIEIQTTEGFTMKEAINRLTLEQFLKVKPTSNKRDLISHTLKRMKSLRISKSTSDLLSLAPTFDASQHLSSLLDLSQGGIELSVKPDSVRPSSIIHDRFSTLQDAFHLVPQEIGFMIEIKYPNLAMQNLRKFKAPERNEFVDIILNIVFNEVKDRRIAFLTFDPDIAILLRTKQFRYPVLFLICCDTPTFFDTFDPDVNVNDTRCNSILNAVTFVKTVNLDGIVCDSETILNNHSYVNLVHNDNLLLFTYGSKNVDPVNVKIQKELGVDGIIADNITKLNKTVHTNTTSAAAQ